MHCNNALLEMKEAIMPVISGKSRGWVIEKVEWRR